MFAFFKKLRLSGIFTEVIEEMNLMGNEAERVYRNQCDDITQVRGIIRIRTLGTTLPLWAFHIARNPNSNADAAEYFKQLRERLVTIVLRDFPYVVEDGDIRTFVFVNVEEVRRSLDTYYEGLMHDNNIKTRAGINELLAYYLQAIGDSLGDLSKFMPTLTTEEKMEMLLGNIMSSLLHASNCSKRWF